jgi:hypothetical protein
VLLPQAHAKEVTTVQECVFLSGWRRHSLAVRDTSGPVVVSTTRAAGHASTALNRLGSLNRKTGSARAARAAAIP